MALWRPFDVDSISNTSVSVSAGPEFQNKDYHVQTQRLILNIFEALKKEYCDKSENCIINKIMELTKLSYSGIYRVIKAGNVTDRYVKRKRQGQRLKPVDEACKDVIRRIIYNFYGSNQVPTLQLIREKLMDYPDYNYKSLGSLRNILLHCGFKYKRINNRMSIMESLRIVRLRQEYLRKIKEFRYQGRNIIFLDETWFDTHDIVKYGWVDESKNCCLNTPCSRGKRVIILHAGNENGFIPNALLLSAKNIRNSSADYHEDMTADLFEKWIKEQLLPNIPPNSVIAMDNASYHSRILNKIPNMTTKKENILTFMHKKNMQILDKIPPKKQLIEKIKAQNFKNEYVVDEICSNHGHTVLRLPPYYCIFNPIEMVWASLKAELRKINQTPTLSAVVLENIRTVINNLDENNLWRNCVRHVVAKENEYYLLPPIEPIIINLEDDSSSDSFSD